MNVFSYLPSRYRVTSEPLKTERRLELAVIASVAFVLLWLVLGVGVNALSNGPAPLPPAEDSLVVTPLLAPTRVAAQGSEQIQARPLFWDSRRPVAPIAVVAGPVEAQPKTAAKLEGVNLRGVFGVGDSLGVIAEVDGKLQRIHVGESVKGWALKDFMGGEAQFESAGTTDSLPLAITTPSVSIRAAPAASQAPPAGGLGSQIQKAIEQRQNSAKSKAAPKPDSKNDELSFGGGA